MDPRIETIIKKAEDMGIFVSVVSLEGPVIKFEKNGISRFSYGIHLPINSAVAVKISQNKHLSKKVLTEGSIKTPLGFVAVSAADAFAKMNKYNLRYPVVVKPNDKYNVKGVSANIESDKEFSAAIKKASEYSKTYIVEDHYYGDDHRLLVLDGRVIAAVKYALPYITGDGKSDVARLVYKFNKKSSSPIKINVELKKRLAKYGYKINTILPAGEKFVLEWNARGYSASVENVSDTVSDWYHNIAVKTANLLGFRFCEVGILAEDITTEFGDYVVTMTNGSPGYSKYDATGYGGKIVEKVINAFFEKSVVINESNYGVR